MKQAVILSAVLMTGLASALAQDAADPRDAEIRGLKAMTAAQAREIKALREQVAKLEAQAPAGNGGPGGGAPPAPRRPLSRGRVSDTYPTGAGSSMPSSILSALRQLQIGLYRRLTS